MEDTDRPASQTHRSSSQKLKPEAQAKSPSQKNKGKQGKGGWNFRSGWLYRIVCLSSFACSRAYACQPKPTAEDRRKSRKKTELRAFDARVENLRRFRSQSLFQLSYIECLPRRWDSNPGPTDNTFYEPTPYR